MCFYATFPAFPSLSAPISLSCCLCPPDAEEEVQEGSEEEGPGPLAKSTVLPTLGVECAVWSLGAFRLKVRWLGWLVAIEPMQWYCGSGGFSMGRLAQRCP